MSSIECSLDWPQAFGGPVGSVVFKQHPEDFQVYEQLPFAPKGEGEHLFLQIEKIGQNTAWLARQLAKLANIQAMDVSYAGLKDRHGVAVQWFCLRIPGLPPADEQAVWQARLSELEGVRLLVAKRHDRKLRSGSLTGNDFVIRLRDFQGVKSALEQRLALIANEGVPNYFGEQRFGRDGHNLILAQKLFTGEIKLARERRGFALSAARSLLFNQVLAERVRIGNWKQLTDGDVLTFPDAASLIYPSRRDDSVPTRFATGDLLNTGPMWGKGKLASEQSVQALEQSIAASSEIFAKGLEQWDMKQERRPLVATVRNLSWEWQGDDIILSFSLYRSCYATAVLAELVTVGNDIVGESPTREN